MPKPAPNSELDSSYVQQFTIASHWLYESECRFDASTYAEGAFVALDALEACPYEKRPLGSLVRTLWHPVQNQARSNFKRIYTSREYGVPFVGSREMFNLPLRPDRFLSKRIPKLGDLMVPENWLLISRSGTIGNVLYVNRNLANCAITEHAIRIEPVGIPAGYLYALLASKYGQQIIAKGAFGATVEQVEPKHIAPMPVPLPSKREYDINAQDTIHGKIRRAYELRDEVTDLLYEADKLLHDIIGLSPFNENDIEYLSHSTKAKAFTIPSSSIVDRFDASSYVPLVRSVLDKLRHGRFPLVPLWQMTTQIFLPPRFKRIYVVKEHGVPFLQGSQLPLMRPYGLKYLSLKANAQYIEECLIVPNWVLVTRSGTIGRVALVSNAQSNWAASEHLLRIVPNDKECHPGYLTAFLLTPFGQHQLKAKIYGGVVDELTVADTQAIWIPRLSQNLQAEIGDRVVAAYQKRDEANELEKQAIDAMEALIKGHAAILNITDAGH
jgi:type I restriction enzyme S subunit